MYRAVFFKQDCRSGICGACKCRVTKEDVEGSSQNGLTEEELSQCNDYQVFYFASFHY